MRERGGVGGTTAPPRGAERATAAVVTAPRTSELRALPLPEPGSGQVRLRLEGSGVCGSSLPVWEGRPWFSYPLAPGAPGHEGWGVVDAIGPGVTAVREGQRVAGLTYQAHAEVDVAEADALVSLPPELDGMPFPAEPLGCAMNVFERSEIAPGRTVAIVGVGFLGALLVRLAADAGARVLALSRRPFALETALRLGAEEAIEVHEPDAAAERVQRLTDGHGCERVIEAVGAQATLTLAGRLAGVRARLVIAGFHQDGPREVDLQHWNWQGLDVINAHEREPARYLSGMRAAVEAVRDGRLDPRPLLTHDYPLDRMPDAYEAMRARPDGFLKAWIRT